MGEVNYCWLLGVDYRWKLWLLFDLVPDVYKTWPETWQSSLPRSRFLGERCVTFKKRLRGRLFTNQSVEKMLCYYKNTNWKLLIQWSKQSFLGLRQRVHFDLKHLLHQKHFNLQETAFLLVVDEEIEREPGISLFPFSCLGQCIVFTQCM